MTNQAIQLKIILPHKVLPTQAVARVIVPATKGNLTVIPDRAPTTLMLTNGVINILSETGESLDKYFVKGGVANIAADECVVMTEKALHLKEIDAQALTALREEHIHELQDLGISANSKDSDILFYEAIEHYLQQSK
ncbi:MAG: F0F1 ATP synthase subunit epsilon [Alphaproteobacteria bacterium]|nr:F0F1 ATP synthase subunit epsilon [Alphaproteobacteria bacterium]